jgi:hypothetical protein
MLAKLTLMPTNRYTEQTTDTVGALPTSITLFQNACPKVLHRDSLTSQYAIGWLHKSKKDTVAV